MVNVPATSSSICEQVHKYLLQPILITYYSMLNQASIVIRDRHPPLHVLKLDQLDDLVQYVVHDKVVILLRNPLSLDILGSMSKFPFNPFLCSYSKYDLAS